MVGSALVRALQKRGHTNLILRTSAELDLRKQSDVHAFLAKEKPQHVYLAAAKVGGIQANSKYKGDFLYDNLILQANVIEGSRMANVDKLLFLGSSCIYPKHAPQPMAEEVLLTGALEPTNEPYAIAKIAGMKLCDAYRHQHGCNFISAMPTNLYGPGDNYHPENSHVLPALIRRFHEAAQAGTEEVMIWGSGRPRREFLHVDDMAEASLYVLGLDREIYDANTEPMLSHINVGTGVDHSIMELAQMVAKVTGFKGRITNDPSKPDGTMRKLMNVDRLADMGWKAAIPLEEGLASTYRWYLDNVESIRA